MTYTKIQMWLTLLNYIIERKPNTMIVIFQQKGVKIKLQNIKKNEIMHQKELFHSIADDVCTSCLTSPMPLVLDFSFIDPVLSFLSIQNVDCKYTDLSQIWHFMAHSKTGRNKIQLILPDFEYPFRCQPKPLHIPRMYIASFKCELLYMNKVYQHFKIQGVSSYNVWGKLQCQGHNWEALTNSYSIKALTQCRIEEGTHRAKVAAHISKQAECWSTHTLNPLIICNWTCSKPGADPCIKSQARRLPCQEI